MKKNNLNFYQLFLSLLISFSLLVLVQGCNIDDFDNRTGTDDNLILEYLANNDIEADKDDSGYYYSVLETNPSGELVEVDDIVSVYYKMTLLDGQHIGSLLQGIDAPAQFKMTNKSLIPVGMRLGTSRMRLGEKYRFYIPSSLAYEFYSFGDFLPSYSVLVVESEVVKIESEEEQKIIEKDSIDNYITTNTIEDMTLTTSGLYFKRTSDEGVGDHPTSGETVRVKYSSSYLDGTLLEETEDDQYFAFILGHTTVIEGFEEGVKLMKKGEKATLILPSHLAYDESLQVFPELFREDLLDIGLITEETPPFSILEFEIELVDIL